MGRYDRNCAAATFYVGCGSDLMLGYCKIRPRGEAAARCEADVLTRAWYRLAQSQDENICLWV